MKSITLKQLRLVSGAIASLGVCLGLYSAVKADDLNIKSFSLLAATSSVIAGMASYGALILGEDVANKQINDIIADQKKAVDTAKRLKEDNSKLSVSLKGKQGEYDNLIANWNELSSEAEQWQEKSQNQVQLAKRYLGEHLKSIQGRLSSAVQTGIRQNNQNTQSSEEHKQHIHKTLTKRLVDLEADIKKWNSWIKDITEEDYLEVCIQILDEITSHKSKIAATSTRLNYHQYVPKGFLRKENALRLNDDYHSTVMEKINEYDEVAANNAEFMAAAGRDIELLKNRLMEREALIADFQKPLRWNNPTRDDLKVGNTIIDYFHGLGIILDRANSLYDDWEAILGFQVDRNIKLYDRLITPSELNAHGDKLQQLAHIFNLPKFSYNPECGWIECTVQLKKKPERQKLEKDLKLKDLLTVGNKRSWLITGHPGAGKTSVMVYLGQQLGEQTAQRIALNPHDDEQSAYEPYGFAEINDLTAILEQINLIYEELELRRQDKTRRFKLVVVIDELGAILDAASKPKELMLIIRQIAVEGRKLEISVIVGNHSQTTKAIEMDAEFRNAFYQVFLVGAARYALDQPNRNTGLKPYQEDWIKNTAYPALLLSNGQYSLVKHPTHGDYEEYKDSGNPPENLEDWDFNYLTISIANGYENYLQKSQYEPKNKPNVLEEQPNNEPNVLGNSVQNSINPQNPVYKGSRFLEFTNPTVKTGENWGVTANPVEPRLTQSEIDSINKNSDKRVSDIVWEVWKVRPSKSSEYQSLKAKVEAFLNK